MTHNSHEESSPVIAGREVVAVLVDGGFYLHRAHYLWGDKPPKERAEELVIYCKRHLKNHIGGQAAEDKLYRIFYYDCPPSEGNIYNPITKKTEPLKKTLTYKWKTDFHNELKSKSKVALRFGRLSSECHYYLSAEATKQLLAGTLLPADIKQSDLKNSIGQKGVDMKLGLDIASMAYKKQVTKMVLIAGDSDFVPAAKLARREGVEVVLDCLYANISPDLNEHIDGKYSRCSNPRTNPDDAAKDPLFRHKGDGAIKTGE